MELYRTPLQFRNLSQPDGPAWYTEIEFSFFVTHLTYIVGGNVSRKRVWNIQYCRTPSISRDRVSWDAIVGRNDIGVTRSPAHAIYAVTPSLPCPSWGVSGCEILPREHLSSLPRALTGHRTRQWSERENPIYGSLGVCNEMSVCVEEEKWLMLQVSC